MSERGSNTLIITLISVLGSIIVAIIATYKPFSEPKDDSKTNPIESPVDDPKPIVPKEEPSKPVTETPKKIVFEDDICENVKKILATVDDDFRPYRTDKVVHQTIGGMTEYESLIKSDDFSVGFKAQAPKTTHPRLELTQRLNNDLIALGQFKVWVKRFEDCLDVESEEVESNDKAVTVQIKAGNHLINFVRAGTLIKIEVASK